MSITCRNSQGHFGLGADYRTGGYLRLWFAWWIVVIDFNKGSGK